MKGYIIDPTHRTIEEIEIPSSSKKQVEEIARILGEPVSLVTFFYPKECRTSTAYYNLPKKGDPFFRVSNFVRKVTFGKTVVIDKTATGFPKSDKVTLDELESMVTFMS